MEQSIPSATETPEQNRENVFPLEKARLQAIQELTDHIEGIGSEAEQEVSAQKPFARIDAIIAGLTKSAEEAARAHDFAREEAARFTLGMAIAQKEYLKYELDAKRLYTDNADSLKNALSDKKAA